MKKPTTIACLGDSLTHGRVSYNWIRYLSREMGDGFRFHNFGVDGDLAYNGLQRIDKVIETKPDYVFVMLGTNDVNASMGDGIADYYMRSKKLPVRPTIKWYKNCIEDIVGILKAQTQAQIFIISVPILGEDLTHETNKRVMRYNEVLREVCEQNSVKYLDFRAKLVDYLEKNPPKNPRALPTEYSIIKYAILRHFLLFQSWDTISEKYGLVLTTDTLHLNARSGKMLAEMVKNILV